MAPPARVPGLRLCVDGRRLQLPIASQPWEIYPLFYGAKHGVGDGVLSRALQLTTAAHPNRLNVDCLTLRAFSSRCWWVRRDRRACRREW